MLQSYAHSACSPLTTPRASDHREQPPTLQKRARTPTQSEGEGEEEGSSRG